MRITIESTTEIINLELPDGRTIPGRVWEGTTESGIEVQAIVTRIAANGEIYKLDQFERELQEQRLPIARERAFPLRMIL